MVEEKKNSSNLLKYSRIIQTIFVVILFAGSVLLFGIGKTMMGGYLRYSHPNDATVRLMGTMFREYIYQRLVSPVAPNETRRTFAWTPEDSELPSGIPLVLADSINANLNKFFLKWADSSQKMSRIPFIVDVNHSFNYPYVYYAHPSVERPPYVIRGALIPRVEFYEELLPSVYDSFVNDHDVGMLMGDWISKGMLTIEFVPRDSTVSTYTLSNMDGDDTEYINTKKIIFGGLGHLALTWNTDDNILGRGVNFLSIVFLVIGIWLIVYTIILRKVLETRDKQ
ncbi:MAG TPA: hypothetical protein ENH10_04350 [Bacteroidetes bacterium]|nr:hypothetical protein BMS3Bbin04_00028 [bacterium BMS3Bbin04]HDO65245.1 hypothetical protein [Bacteroidota bacterium]HEX04370.1 hypothetical protein [Bacteroidota bacterium]